ncbi:Mog1/PsbP, alpha/beta/alpha sandwich [Ostreococcus tauri]|uniref:Mog1/PsbP, alpha/beta/alpha sandwich n=1 Tax=Ostreococcus tauri TaxID=70448 RepID=A0A090M4I3_OSTTA|nr:Mog1/PsbP, alpha/beta/alpha sandwich [Ostreococcus tauri]CEF96889.1 Mog1/PsbP, alpha/beta/alpha sandwich [Ostreococcus tauri]|eukprot:XP_003074648.2 Mog1/PsbP, alpha/beta/alpha sandwich [Ostreococcus tauri]
MSLALRPGTARRAPIARASASRSRPRRASTARSSDAEASRRDVLGASALAMLANVVPLAPARADESLRTYADDELRFTLEYPSDWVVATGSLERSENPMGGGARDVWTISPPGRTRDVNVTVVATPAGADFTKMGSLGDAYGFGMGLVAPLHRPKLKKGREDRVQRAELVDAYGKGDYYKVEYTFERPAADIDSVFLVLAGLGYDGRVGHLYTTTAQFPRAEESKWRAQIEAIVDSVKYPKALYG